MRTVQAIQSTLPDGTVQQGPEESPWPPADAIAVVCDGSTYTVYEPGDTVPEIAAQ